jgi:acyl phosphate:glycerol-3-phosphate acyltransferase
VIGQVVLVIAAYVGGSLPWGYWAGRMAGIDIRTQGSGNTGATNVWRVLGPRYGLPVLLLDVAKGFVPTLIGLHMAGAGTAVLAGSAAVIGHAFPIFLGFGGGKGVATAGGVVIALTPVLAVVLAIVLVAVLWLFRYVSLASMVVAVLYPIGCIVTGEPWPVVAFGLLAAAGILVRHRTNIRRLLQGTEAKAKTFGRGAGAKA